VFGKANGRSTDIDGISMWKTNNKRDVDNMFKIRKGIAGRPSSDAHNAYTKEQLAEKGVKVNETPGDGPLNKVLHPLCQRA
jgi:hypothetical protein